MERLIASGASMGEHEDVAFICEECGTGYYSESAMERCDCGDTTATLSPSKQRVRYDLGYD